MIAGLRTSLSVIAVIALMALFFSLSIPTEQPAAARSKTRASTTTPVQCRPPTLAQPFNQILDHQQGEHGKHDHGRPLTMAPDPPPFVRSIAPIVQAGATTKHSRGISSSTSITTLNATTSSMWATVWNAVLGLRLPSDSPGSLRLAIVSRSRGVGSESRAAGWLSSQPIEQASEQVRPRILQPDPPNASSSPIDCYAYDWAP